MKTIQMVVLILLFMFCAVTASAVTNLTVEGSLVITNGASYIRDGLGYVYNGIDSHVPRVVLNSTLPIYGSGAACVDMVRNNTNDVTRMFSIFHGSLWGSGLRMGAGTSTWTHLAYSLEEPYPGWYVDHGLTIYGESYSATNSARIGHDFFKLPALMAAPENPEAGTFYIDGLDGNILKVWDGVAWQALRKEAELDDRYVLQSGDSVESLTVDGDLSVSGRISGDGSGLTSLSEADPVWGSEKGAYLTKVVADQAYIGVLGGEMNGSLTATPQGLDDPGFAVTGSSLKYKFFELKNDQDLSEWNLCMDTVIDDMPNAFAIWYSSDGVSDWSAPFRIDTNGVLYANGSGLTGLDFSEVIEQELSLNTDKVPSCAAVSAAIASIPSSGGTFDDSALLKMDGSRSMLGDLNLGANKAIDLADAVDLTDAANLKNVRDEIGAAMQYVGPYGDIPMFDASL